MAIELIQHVGGEITSGTALTVQIDNVTSGNTLIGCIVARGAITVDDSWTFICSGAAVESDKIIQTMYFYQKEVGNTISHSLSVAENISNGRVYIGIMEFTGICNITPFCDIADNNTRDLEVPDKQEGEILLWGIQSITWGSDNWQTTPDDIQKIDYGFQQNRLVNYFDTGIGGMSRKFSIRSNICQIGILALMLRESQKFFLFRSDNIVYTFADGVMTALDATEMDSAVFQEYGCLRDQINFEALKELHNPEIYEWQAEADKHIAGIDVAMTGITLPQTITQSFRLDRSDIKGVGKITAVYAGEPTATLSVDGGVTYWAYLEGAWQEMSGTDGMSIASLELVTLEQWAELITGATELIVRMLLIQDSSVESITISYMN